MADSRAWLWRTTSREETLAWTQDGCQDDGPAVPVKPAASTHIDHLLRILVDGGEVGSGSVRLGQTNQVQGDCRGQWGSEQRPLVLTLKYCTLKSSAPVSTEELMRHRGRPPASERAESHRHLHLLTTPRCAGDPPPKQEVPALTSLVNDDWSGSIETGSRSESPPKQREQNGFISRWW